MFRSTTRSSSRSSRPIWRMSRSATSPGERIDQRPEGQSARSRRPSSNAAVSWPALATPTPGMASSSRSEARASPVSPSFRARASSARSTALAPRAPEPQMSAMSSAVVSPPTPRSARRSRGRSSAGTSRIARPRRPSPRPDRNERVVRAGPVRVAGCRLRSWPGLLELGRRRRPGPGRREPADLPRHPDPGTTRAYRAPLIGRMPGSSPRIDGCRLRGSGHREGRPGRRRR